MKRNERALIPLVYISAGFGRTGSVDAPASAERFAARPYRDITLIGRILREIWFRIGLPEKVWYNSSVLSYRPERITVTDPLITVGYLTWLKKNNPESVITFRYTNLVGSSRHLLPDQIPDGIEISTYDPRDSEKYHLTLKQGGEFPACFYRERKPIEFDVFYVGADKGRGEYLLSLKKQFEEMGLHVKMIITASGRFSKRKAYYQKPIPYREVLDYDVRSRAIMNIILPGQEGATMRDFEALVLRSKLITNNPKVELFDFYKKENIFILGKDDLSALPEFLRSPWAEVDPDIVEHHIAR